MYDYRINKQIYNNTRLFCVEMFQGENVIDDTVIYCHDSFKIIYLHQGEIEVELENIKYDLNPGDLLLINPSELHMIRNRSNMHLIIIYFKPEFISYGENQNSFLQSNFLSRKSPTPRHSFKNVADDDIVHDIFNIWEEFNLKKFTSALMIKADILNLLLWITCDSNEPTHIITGTPTCNRQNKIKEIINYVNQNYAEDITLQGMAKRFNIDYCYLSKEFKRLTSLNFNTYLNTIRTNNSKFLLRTTTLTIAEISQKVGYSSQSYYTEQFTLLNNISPQKFRAKFR